MLIDAVPGSDASANDELIPIGERPSPLNLPQGCRFNSRCPFAFEKCRTVEPMLIEVKSGHFAACFLNERK